MIGVYRNLLGTLWRKREHRDRAMIRAVGTALGAKGCGFVLQIIALPFAVRTLGMETYGIYATAAALFGWVSLVESGVGANAVRSMVAAINCRDSARLGGVALTNLAITSALGGCFVVVAGVLLQALSASGVALNTPGTRNLLWTTIGLCGLQLASAAILRVRGAYQETHINNLYGAAGSLLSAVMLYFSVKMHGGALALLLSLNAPTVLMQLLNGTAFWLKRRDLLTKARIEWSEVGLLLKGGSLLSMAQAGILIEREAPKFVLVALASASAVGQYACAAQILAVIAGLVVMVSTPLLPAIADAHVSGEHIWWQRRVRQTLAAITGFGLIGTCFAYVWGQGLLISLFGASMKLSASDCVGLAIWCSVVLLSHILFVTLVAIGKHRPVAILQFVQGAAVLAAFYWIYPFIGLGGMFWVIGLLGVLLTFLPWLRVITQIQRAT